MTYAEPPSTEAGAAAGRPSGPRGILRGDGAAACSDGERIRRAVRFPSPTSSPAEIRTRPRTSPSDRAELYYTEAEVEKFRERFHRARRRGLLPEGSFLGPFGPGAVSKADSLKDGLMDSLVGAKAKENDGRRRKKSGEERAGRRRRRSSSAPANCRHEGRDGTAALEAEACSLLRMLRDHDTFLSGVGERHSDGDDGAASAAVAPPAPSPVPPKTKTPPPRSPSKKSGRVAPLVDAAPVGGGAASKCKDGLRREHVIVSPFRRAGIRREHAVVSPFRRMPSRIRC